VKQLLGIGCHQPVFAGSSNKILSCADAVAKGLALQSRKEAKITEQPSEERKEVKTDAIEQSVDKIKGISENLKKGKEALAQGACPECGSPVQCQEGCKFCSSCGWNEC
jgi:ribonucleoside-diphosphate reductase alpha chain